MALIDDSPSPEDVLRDIEARLGSLDGHERWALGRHLALALEYFNEVMAERRRAPREPGKDEL
jgi:hypothetical protein